MKPAHSIWELPEKTEHQALLDVIKARRGYDTDEKILNPPSMVNTALLMNDMPKGVKIIKDAIANDQILGIVGDYDVDGGTAAACLYRGLTHCPKTTVMQQQLKKRLKELVAQKKAEPDVVTSFDVHGIFDAPTQKALIAYQGMLGYSETGVCDEKTWQALLQGVDPLAVESLKEDGVIPTLRRDHRPIVITLQAALGLVQHGVYDAELQEAVRKFQASQNLPETGQMNVDTWIALDNDLTLRNLQAALDVFDLPTADPEKLALLRDAVRQVMKGTGSLAAVDVAFREAVPGLADAEVSLEKATVQAGRQVAAASAVAEQQISTAQNKLKEIQGEMDKARARAVKMAGEAALTWAPVGPASREFSNGKISPAEFTLRMQGLHSTALAGDKSFEGFLGRMQKATDLMENFQAALEQQEGETRTAILSANKTLGAVERQAFRSVAAAKKMVHEIKAPGKTLQTAVRERYDQVTRGRDVYENQEVYPPLQPGQKLVKILRPYVPQRTEGYGLSKLGIDSLRARKADVVITVDNGTNAREAVEYAKAQGIKVIVTDHHPAHDDQIAAPDALINPQIKSDYPFPYLCGAGVAYMFLRALTEEGVIGETKNLIAYAAVGTLADVMPMQHANRLLVQHGLHESQMRQHIGMWALYQHTLRNTPDKRRENPILTRGRIPASTVGFGMGPLINAAGRMGSPELSLDLLLTDSVSEAHSLVSQLEEINVERKVLMKHCEEEAMEMAEELPDSKLTVALYSPNWYHGIVGPVAARVAEKYARPVYIGALDEEGIIAGSARTGCAISCAELLDGGPTERHGGHAAAAGFTVKEENWEAFCEHLEKRAEEKMVAGDFQRKITIDAVWNIPSTAELMEVVSALEPIGKEFEDPRIVANNVLIKRKGYSKKNPNSKYCWLLVVDQETHEESFVTAFDRLESVNAGDVVPKMALKLTADGLQLENIEMEAGLVL